MIFDYFDEQFNDGEYTKFDNLKPVVSTEMNFDQVRGPLARRCSPVRVGTMHLRRVWHVA